MGFLGSLGVLLGSANAADSWPQFRGPTGQGLSTATNVPIRWSTSENVAWKTPISGSGWSSPVVANGKIFLSSAVSTNGSVELRALRVDAATGNVDWSTKVFERDAGGTGQLHSKNTLASPTPIIEGDRLFVHFGPNGSAALSVEGEVIWAKNEIIYSPVHGGGGSPVLVDGVLVFSCDGASDPFLAGLDAKTGSIKWKTPRKTHAKRTFSFATPLVITDDNVTQIISPTSGFVGAYSPATGAELWRVEYGEGYSVVPRPVFAHGALYVSSGFDRPIMHAINPKGAKGNATESNVKWTINKGAPTTPSSLVVGNELYFVSDGGIATCADATSGKVHWSERVGGNYSTSPISAEKRIYFINEAGVATVIKAATKFETLATSDLGEKALASPAAVDNALFIRTEHHLWKIANR